MPAVHPEARDHLVHAGSGGVYAWSVPKSIDGEKVAAALSFDEASKRWVATKGTAAEAVAELIAAGRKDLRARQANRES